MATALMHSATVTRRIEIWVNGAPTFQNQQIASGLRCLLDEGNRGIPEPGDATTAETVLEADKYARLFALPALADGGIWSTAVAADKRRILPGDTVAVTTASRTSVWSVPVGGVVAAETMAGPHHLEVRLRSVG